MDHSNSKIDQLSQKLSELLNQHEAFSAEILNLRSEIEALKAKNQGNISEPVPVVEPAPVAKPEVETEPAVEPKAVADVPKKARTQEATQMQSEMQQPIKKKKRSDWEKFIGENLINKIGIAITVIGVSIGAKYSIEHELISPLTRIILGYVMGIGLLGIGLKLKSKYEAYSAVLVSGAMAIMYFITYAAYAFYELFPQMIAFLLMVIFTVFTVLAAIKYNRQVIAHIGLVGAYAVPFLLSEGSGKVEILFSYVTIINIGILVISFKKYWKPLFYAAFAVTWLTFMGWMVSSFDVETHFTLALTFLSIFFVIFYITFLAYKVKREEPFHPTQVTILLLNASIYYGLGYVILDQHEIGTHLLGAFTLMNGGIHLVAYLILKSKLHADENLKHLLLGLVMVFVTITISVQLDGNWVTMLWVAEAALLFWVGRTKGIRFYEVFSYPLMLLAFFSMGQDWDAMYNLYNADIEDYTMPLINVNFMASFFFILGFGFINYINANSNYTPATKKSDGLYTLMNYAIPAILIFALYNAFRLEIAAYWDALFFNSEHIDNSINTPIGTRNQDFHLFKTIWIINYSFLFFAILAFVNFVKLKNRDLGLSNLILNVLTTMVFLVVGLYDISELRESYLSQTNGEYFNIGFFHIAIRYISLALVALSVYTTWRYIRQPWMKLNITKGFDLYIYLLILWVTSSELIGILDMMGVEGQYKMSLSILWGVFALSVISIGIWKKKQYLRIGAIVVFGVTLIKLFAYDIDKMSTVSKTIAFVSLGILLLVISFLYNKFKHLIKGDE